MLLGARCEGVSGNRMTTFLSNRSIYESVICGIVPQTKARLWIATADIKDMYVEPPSRVSRAMEVIFCCFSERDVKVYQAIL